MKFIITLSTAIELTAGSEPDLETLALCIKNAVETETGGTANVLTLAKDIYEP